MGVIFPKPWGKNDLANPYMFSERLKYKQKSFNGADPIPIDMLYEKPFYGKVDKKGRTIYPSEVNMEQIPGSGLLMVHDFVAHAFSRLKSEVELIASFKNHNFASMFPSGYVPVSAMHNFHKLYQNHFVDNVYNVFINNWIIGTSRKRHIRTFPNFVKQFVDFSDFMNDQFPVTKTGFIMSPMCPHAISGFIIELEGLDKDDDSKKYDGWISNPSFRKYARLVAAFGFYVDKNCPWRIAANLDHPYMTQNAMPAYGTSYEDGRMFKDYFYQAEYYSYEDFKVRMWYGYRSLLVDNDTNTFGLITQVRNCTRETHADLLSQSFNTKWKKGFLKEISEDFDKFLLEYPDSFFLPHYFKIRVSESGKKMKDNQYNAKLRNILKINELHGISRALLAIGDITKQSNIYLKNENAEYPRKIKYFGKSISSGLHSYKERDKVASEDIKTSNIMTDSEYL